MNYFFASAECLLAVGLAVPGSCEDVHAFQLMETFRGYG